MARLARSARFVKNCPQSSCKLSWTGRRAARHLRNYLYSSTFQKCNPQSINCLRADATDLKSFSRQRECGFDSHPGHQLTASRHNAAAQTGPQRGAEVRDGQQLLKRARRTDLRTCAEGDGGAQCHPAKTNCERATSKRLLQCTPLPPA